VDVSVKTERQLPTRWDAVVFGAKAWCLRVQRRLSDLGEELRRWPIESGGEGVWQDVHAIRTPLWTEDNDAERELELGKVQNLRRAAELLNGVVVAEGGVFSFWRQVGKTTAARGFRVGRMLQQGCVVPAVGGGICQLTNALYETALRSGCAIVERHGHSVRMPHAPVHDATVAWNYVDLRFRARQAMRVRVLVDADAMTVAVQYREPARYRPTQLQVQGAELPVVSVRSCTSCGETSCFRHEAKPVTPGSKSK